MTTAVAPPTPRVPFWDNARFVSVTLVVIGHAIQRLTGDSNNALILYLFIYAFHMPAFAVISGYFSKASPPTTRRMKRVLTDILLPYVIMETIWTAVKYFVEGNDRFNPTDPSWTLWFLLALGIFRLVLPYLVILRFPLLWALFFSVMIGYFSNVDSTFSLSRAIGILPFFVLGWQARQWGVADRLLALGRRIWVWRVAAAGVFAAWLVAVVVGIEFWREFGLQYWFFYDDAYRLLGEDEWWAGLVRLALILLAAVLSAAFFILMPRSETWITLFGQATMYVYLLHSFILYPLRETGVLTGEHSSAVWLVGMVFASIAISILLTAPLVWRVFRPVIEPRLPWLFIRSAQEPAARRDPTGAWRD